MLNGWKLLLYVDFDKVSDFLHFNCYFLSKNALPLCFAKFDCDNFATRDKKRKEKKLPPKIKRWGRGGGISIHNNTGISAEWGSHPTKMNYNTIDIYVRVMKE